MQKIFREISEAYSAIQWKGRLLDDSLPLCCDPNKAYRATSGIWLVVTSQPGEKFVAFTRDPVLAVWKAMNLLADVYPDSSELSNLITESEMILFSLILALVRAEKTGSVAPSLARLVIH